MRARAGIHGSTAGKAVTPKAHKSAKADLSDRSDRSNAAARVEELAALGCTAEEICAQLDCSPEKLRARFAPQLRRGLARLRHRLRQLLLDSAEAGKLPAQIWLGRLHLGRVEEERQPEAPARTREELANMTTSEMLEDYLKIATRGRGGVS